MMFALQIALLVVWYLVPELPWYLVFAPLMVMAAWWALLFVLTVTAAVTK